MAILDIFRSKNDEAAATDAPNATDLLKRDHDTVRGLFKEFRNAGERAYKEKARLFTEIDRELSVHTRIEEEIFYPAVTASRGKGTTKLVLEAQEEHTVVKRLLKELQGLDPETGTFDAKMQVLMEEIDHHADEEEDDMFPEAKESLGDDRLQELGDRMQTRKDHLLRNPSSLKQSGPARRSPRTARKPASSSSSRDRTNKKASPAKKRGATKRSATKRGTTKRGTTKQGATKRAVARVVKKAPRR